MIWIALGSNIEFGNKEVQDTKSKILHIKSVISLKFQPTNKQINIQKSNISIYIPHTKLA